MLVDGPKYEWISAFIVCSFNCGISISQFIAPLA
ncbi:hypothetical protein RD1_4056 [Roseobacter denitrificans OCh 114]|uniref:Uncharacterized protein n=1 Tax=Roseobacter denitrificans (strain ATCC 33942 / OCh 114) TaxID=375451 RepID=Q160U3_ROSDO|nr:hypothetical protein RD1_4056 [Roseobacter denitrificans OCh 114]